MAHDIEYTFRNGVKFGPGGQHATPVKCKESVSSNGLTKYLTILWSDGTYSCNCPAWCMRKAGKARDCKHCKTCRAQSEDMQNIGDVVADVTTITSRQPRYIRLH